MPRRRKRMLNPVIITGLIIAGVVVLAWAGLSAGLLKTQVMPVAVPSVMGMPVSQPVAGPVIGAPIAVVTAPPLPTPVVPTPSASPVPPVGSLPGQSAQPTLQPSVQPSTTPCPTGGDPLSFFSRLLMAAVAPAPCVVIAVDDNYNIPPPNTDIAHNVTRNDTINGNVINNLPADLFVELSAPANFQHGSWVVPLSNSGSFVYRANFNTPGVDVFRYTLARDIPNDQGGTIRVSVSNEATARILVGAGGGDWYCVNKWPYVKYPVTSFWVWPKTKPTPGKPFCTKDPICQNGSLKTVDGVLQVNCDTADPANIIQPANFQPASSAESTWYGQYYWHYGHLFGQTTDQAAGGYATVQACQQECKAESDGLVEDWYGQQLASLQAQYNSLPWWNWWGKQFININIWQMNYFHPKLKAGSKVEL